MAMNKEAKQDKLAEETVEVCIRVMVKNASAEAVEKALVEAAEKMDGVVRNVGGYVEAFESHDLEDMLDSIPDEVVEAL